MANSWFPRWRPVQTSGPGQIVAPDERLPLGQTVLMGAQHTVAMFGSTVLAPLLMGFDPNLAILMSGIGTLLFFLVVGGRVPSYLGSSFGFIGVVIAVTGYAGHGVNPNIAEALGGIVACGAVCVVVGVLVMAAGARWIETLMPPVVTGAIVAVIGLNLAPVAIRSVSGSGFDSAIAILTVLCVGAVAIFARGTLQRLLILLGLLLAYVLYVVLTNGLGLGRPIDFSGIAAAPWFGLPSLTTPRFTTHGMLLIVPVAIILIAENLGHIKAVGAMAGQPLDRYMGRAFVGDGLATMLSGAVGGTGVTTYAENIGVMAVTRIYSTLVFVAAAVIAIAFGLSPKFGALVKTIPGPVLGGTSIIVFGLIAVSGARIWMQNQVDFSRNRNLIVAAVTLVLGAGDFTIHLWGFPLGGIGTATFGAILLNAVFSLERRS
ncbi:MAG: solute carrier family 23 protein [Janthinobacterium lividum]